MGKYQLISNGVIYAIEQLLKDDDLCKLVGYDDYDPLSQSSYSNPKSLLLTRIFPLPKIPDVTEPKKTIITVVPISGEISDNIQFKDYKLVFCVTSHIDLWLTKSAVRPFLIGDRLDEIFSKKHISELNIGKTLPSTKFAVQKWNELFYGVYFSYTFTM